MERQPNYRFAAENPDHIMISIFDDPRTTMAVTWRTSTAVDEGYVEYYSEDGEKLTVKALTKPFKSDVNTSNIHWAHLTGLKPGTKYFYTCGSDTVRSEEFSFTTQEDGLTKFRSLPSYLWQFFLLLKLLQFLRRHQLNHSY